MRKLLFQQLDDVLKSMVGRARLGMDIGRGNLKRSLGLSTKSLLASSQRSSGADHRTARFREKSCQSEKLRQSLEGCRLCGIGVRWCAKCSEGTAGVYNRDGAGMYQEQV